MKNKKLELVYINSNYTEILRLTTDKNVTMNDGDKKRPYVGPILEEFGYKFYAPITHVTHITKENQDFYFDLGHYGTILLRNMIPVPDEYVEEFIPKVKDSLLENALAHKHLKKMIEQFENKSLALERKGKRTIKFELEKEPKTPYYGLTCKFDKLAKKTSTLEKLSNDNLKYLLDKINKEQCYLKEKQKAKKQLERMFDNHYNKQPIY